MNAVLESFASDAERILYWCNQIRENQPNGVGERVDFIADIAQRMIHDINLLTQQGNG